MTLNECIELNRRINSSAAWDATREKVARDEAEIKAKAEALRELGAGKKLRYARAAYAKRILAGK